MGTIGIVAGSFDPITNGHMWLINQACDAVDKLYVVVGVNPAKKYTFTTDNREEMVREVINVELGWERSLKVEVVPYLGAPQRAKAVTESDVESV